MELDGKVVHLRGVTCPSPDAEEGRAAKAMLNTFLRGGEVECRVTIWLHGRRATCTKEGREIATGMRQSGYCSPSSE